MSQPEMERRIRWLTRYAALTTVMMAVLMAGGFAPARGPEEITVERINVVEPDGRLAVVISNEARRPGIVLDGGERTDRSGTSGLLFFNSEGDEAGGISMSSERDSAGRFRRAIQQLALDRFESDQVVAVRYVEDENGMSAGLHVSDFPRHMLVRWFAVRDSIAALPAEARAAAQAALRSRASEFSEVPRLFVGTANRAATLEMRDAGGRTRIRMAVDSLGVPALEFLDASGGVVRRLPEDAGTSAARP